ncbi:MAG: hypothetical protein KGJ03_12795 [Betaproteobacteria bacterium]|nr:hypothetical protein [Betaproteobacteria bacterium]MBU6513051.1 hypothetical protein [Betaproteobacteria bacterium]MDE1956590.1 hypothetical protein [Betaproteobacteria bacterium]MDE2154003.1 hypothetical protein [Betaproteobacteria bacterium]MDE2480027.1 hypothetical protein [Betaproteobacteria bacterium]
MPPEEVQLLLRKQRLQLRIAQQRVACLGLLEQAEGLMSAAQRLRNLGAGLGGLLREHSTLAATLGSLFLLWRPRGALRWLRNGWLLWLGLRRGRGRLQAWLRLLGRLAGV